MARLDAAVPRRCQREPITGVLVHKPRLEELDEGTSRVPAPHAGSVGQLRQGDRSTPRKLKQQALLLAVQLDAPCLAAGHAPGAGRAPSWPFADPMATRSVLFFIYLQAIIIN